MQLSHGYILYVRILRYSRYADINLLHVKQGHNSKRNSQKI